MVQLQRQVSSLESSPESGAGARILLISTFLTSLKCFDFFFKLSVLNDVFSDIVQIVTLKTEGPNLRSFFLCGDNMKAIKNLCHAEV